MFLPCAVQTPASLLDRITADPRVLGGKPVIRGLRISVEQVLKGLGAGLSEAELLHEHPDLEPEDFRAVLLYAADAVRTHRVYRLAA